MAELEIKRRRRYSNQTDNPNTVALQSSTQKRAAKAAKRLDFNVDVPDSSSSDDSNWKTTAFSSLSIRKVVRIVTNDRLMGFQV